MFRFLGCMPVRACFLFQRSEVIYFQWESQATLASTQATVLCRHRSPELVWGVGVVHCHLPYPPLHISHFRRQQEHLSHCKRTSEESGTKGGRKEKELVDPNLTTGKNPTI